MGVLFGGIRAPSTLGSFLRSFTWGNVLQLQKCTGSSWQNWPAAPRCCLFQQVSARAPRGEGHGRLAAQWEALWLQSQGGVRHNALGIA